LAEHFLVCIPLDLLKFQEINSSESENDNSLEENASIFNRTESEIDLFTKNLQEVKSNLTISAATFMVTFQESS
ncbi:3730_t:CDS:1, partial [Cetraspora pellucida]